MDGLLSGKRALVTGASRGLGRAIAGALMEEGAYVIGVARASAELDELARSLGGNGEIWAQDVTADAMPDRIVALPNLDILVNNAGINVPAPLEECEDGILDKMLALNIRAPFRIARAAAARMSGGSVIVNMSSQMGHVGAPNRSIYCMTKHAIEGLTRALAVELAARGIRVNAVAPGFVRTPMTAPMLEDAAFCDHVIRSTPMGKLATATDVAAAVSYLVSDRAGAVTGHSLLLDGGWTAQ